MQFHSKYNSLVFCWNQITIKRTEFLVESNMVHQVVHFILTYFDYISSCVFHSWYVCLSPTLHRQLSKINIRNSVMFGQNNNLCTKKYFTQQASLTSDRHDKINFITVKNIFMCHLNWMLLVCLQLNAWQFAKFITRHNFI